ncbi:UNVERIFIED_CONTAM: hypothetical protein PYX00_009392 [Menopon gallinae]|uniref:Uncharacterized protein n=1 Tax=Menopon gallinae TaxID=328185 RepID=A0AAW2HB23_9NEOP
MVFGSKLLVGVFFCLAFLLSLTKLLWAIVGRPAADERSEADIWLQEQNLSEYRTLFKEHEVVREEESEVADGMGRSLLA